MPELPVKIDNLDGVPDSIAKTCRELANLMAGGLTLNKAAIQLGIAPTTARNWPFLYPQVKDFFARAREMWAESKADELADLHEQGLNPQVFRTHSENLKWLIARRNPNTFGDKASQAGQANAALIDVLQAAIKRIPKPDIDPVKVIDSQAIENKGNNLDE